MTLNDAKIGRVYKIVQTGGEGNQKRRLLDMGFTPNTEIFLAHTAPFGGTVLVSLRGFTVALREDASALIEIEEI